MLIIQSLIYTQLSSEQFKIIHGLGENPNPPVCLALTFPCEEEVVGEWTCKFIVFHPSPDCCPSEEVMGEWTCRFVVFCPSPDSVAHLKKSWVSGHVDPLCSTLAQPILNWMKDVEPLCSTLAQPILNWMKDM